MSPDELRDFLVGAEHYFKQRKSQRVPIRCEEGEKFAAYTLAELSAKEAHRTLQGCQDWKSRKSRGGETEGSSSRRCDTKGQAGFHCLWHDKAAREGLELVLHKMTLNPSCWKTFR